jgi:hypothetical protein
MKSDYDALMQHAADMARFDGIEGHKHVKIAPPAPVKTAEVSFEDVKRMQEPKQ